MSRQLRPSPHCLNCGTAVVTRFCAECGQENTSYRVSLGRLAGDLFEEVFQLESRLWRTVWALFRRPGLLTREYNAGRRVRYTTPLRLYLLTSFVYFFVAAFTPQHMVTSTDLQIDAGSHAGELRHLPPATNWFDRRVRERLGITDHIDAETANVANRRAREFLVANTPKVMALLVPLFAALVMLFFRGRFYVEHLVFSLHVHSFYFALGALAELTRLKGVENLAQLASVAWAYVALRAVYEQSWARTAWKTLLLAMIYALFVGIGVIGGLVLGLFF